MPAATPRLFWRRVAATFIDLILASLLTTLILLPFLGNTDKVRLDNGGIYFYVCKQIPNATQEVFDLIAPEKPIAATLCKNTVFGIFNGLTLSVVTAINKTENSAVSRRISLQVDDNGIPVHPLMPQSPVNFALLVGLGGWLLLRSGQTAGKRILGLRVTSPHPFWREALKYICLLPTAVLTLCMTLIWEKTYHALGTLSFAALLSIFALFCLFFFAYYILPWLRWRGAMPWDRLSGSTVTRATKDIPNA